MIDRETSYERNTNYISQHSPYMSSNGSPWMKKWLTKIKGSPPTQLSGSLRIPHCKHAQSPHFCRTWQNGLFQQSVNQMWTYEESWQDEADDGNGEQLWGDCEWLDEGDRQGWTHMECSVWSSVLTQSQISGGISTWQWVAKWPEQPHWKQFPSLLGSHHIYPLESFFPPPELPWSPPPELVQLPPDLPLLRAGNGKPFLSPQDRCPQGFEFRPQMISAVSVGSVMYLGCDKDQWRWRSKCISYVVLRGVILEQWNGLLT